MRCPHCAYASGEDKIASHLYLTHGEGSPIPGTSKKKRIHKRFMVPAAVEGLTAYTPATEVPPSPVRAGGRLSSFSVGASAAWGLYFRDGVPVRDIDDWRDFQRGWEEAMGWLEQHHMANVAQLLSEIHRLKTGV